MDIIYGLKTGDTAVFNEVVSTWQNKVYNTAISIVQNAEDAEDADDIGAPFIH